MGCSQAIEPVLSAFAAMRSPLFLSKGLHSKERQSIANQRTQLNLQCRMKTTFCALSYGFSKDNAWRGVENQTQDK
jgi:hypothetical protein